MIWELFKHILNKIELKPLNADKDQQTDKLTKAGIGLGTSN
jgi:hypothetical protein